MDKMDIVAVIAVILMALTVATIVFGKRQAQSYRIKADRPEREGDAEPHEVFLPDDEWRPAPDSDVMAALRAGVKIEAIKHYRNAYGVSLAEAKRAVDRLASEL